MLFCLYQDTKDFTAQINIIDQLDLALELRTGVTDSQRRQTSELQDELSIGFGC